MRKPALQIAAVNKPETTYPKMRRNVLYHVWSFPELQNIDIMKCGPEYVVRYKNLEHACHIRALDDLTYAGWEKLCRQVREEWLKRNPEES